MFDYEKVVVNAVFHKSYREDYPVEIRIYVDRIMIINFSGSDTVRNCG